MVNDNNNIKKTNKRKSHASVALVYFITLAVVLLVIGGISFFVMEKFVFTDESSVTSSEQDLTPTKSDNATHLYMMVDDKKNLETILVERFLPGSAKIVLLPLSEKTVAADSSQTLAKAYASGGSSEVTENIEKLLDIEIDNFIVLNHSNFENVIDNLATINYTVPETVYYIDDDSDDVLNYEQGEELTLFGSEMRLFLTYPDYNDGPGHNQKVFGELLSKVINQGLSTSLTVQNLGSTFKTLVKGSDDKNFSLNDFNDEMKNNIDYIIDNSNEPAQYITATGVWNAEGTQFTVEESFKTQLKNLFEL